MTRNIALLRQALQMPCKRCPQAKPGEPCRDLFGRPMEVPHSVRYGALPSQGIHF